VVRALERFRPPGPPGSIVLANGRPAHAGRRSELTISIRQSFMIGSAFDATTDRFVLAVVGYYYSLRDLNEREIVSWHWHPETPHTIPFPHLHLGPAAQVGRAEMHRAHLPIGIVTVADVVRSASADFGVEPLCDDWAAVLDSTPA
jgi:hypothetical protein